MPPSKRQKTARDSGIHLDPDSDNSISNSPRPHKTDRRALNEVSGNDRSNPIPISPSPTKERSGHDNNTNKEDEGPYKYICFNRPFFDVDGENWLAWSDGKAERLDKKDVLSKLFMPGYDKEEEKGIWKAPAEQHKDHKWVIMWGAWLKNDILCRKAKYCDPDNFGMNMYTDWRGWGMTEIGENMMLEFDQAFRKKTEKRIENMWMVISAMGLWLNTDENMSALISNEDGETACELVGLIGCALLTALSAIDHAGELKPDSRIRDLPLVIAEYLELSHDLPAYGIEGECVSWRKEAVAYFKKGKLDPKRGLFATQRRLEKLENAPDYELLPGEALEDLRKDTAEVVSKGGRRVSPPPLKRSSKGKGGGTKDSEKDQWGWDVKCKAYKKRQNPKMGSQHYDITKMSRADRAAAAYDGKDPLAKVPVKALRENLIDLPSF